MATRAVLFDLFDTLVDLVLEGLPLVQMGQRRLPSTYQTLHEVIVQRSALDFERFARELGSVDREGRQRALAEGRPLTQWVRTERVQATSSEYALVSAPPGSG